MGKIGVYSAIYMENWIRPEKPAIAIRIVGGSASRYQRMDLKPLLQSKSWKKEFIYTFDDDDPRKYGEDTKKAMGDEGFVFFDETIAQKIIRDFEDNGQGIEELIVHCEMGQSRSPAVALALREIFNLQDWEFEMDATARPNHFVYDTMIMAALGMNYPVKV